MPRCPSIPLSSITPRKGEDITEPFYTPARVRVEFGEPIDLSPFYEERKTQELLDQVTHFLMTRLAELGGVEYPYELDENSQKESQQASSA